MAARQDGHWPAPVFTHGDLNPFNVFVRDGLVVGILDWEFAGWYPAYWEYTAAWHGNRTRQAWQGVLTEFLDAYPEELKMEITRQKWWGDLQAADVIPLSRKLLSNYLQPITSLAFKVPFLYAQPYPTSA